MQGSDNLKIKLNVSDENYEEIEQKLLSAGFEIDDDAPFVLSQKDVFPSFLSAKSPAGDKVKLLVKDIVFIESYGHEVIIHTTDNIAYHSTERLYQLSATLDNNKFLRVSNCAIISKNHVKKIKPTLSMKFVLTMSDGSLVDVTRSYYNSFKEFFRI